MNRIFFDLPLLRNALKPFTLTRPVAGLRVGILTLEEKWQRYLAKTTGGGGGSYLTEAYLHPKYPIKLGENSLLINASVCPTADLAQQVAGLSSRQVLRQGDMLVAACLPAEDLAYLSPDYFRQHDYEATAQSVLDRAAGYKTVTWEEHMISITHPWDIFVHNAEQLEQDYALITHQRESQTLSDPYTHVYHPERIFIEEGAIIRAATINAEAGPVYIGKNAMVHEHAVIKGPFAMLEGAHVNIGSKIREATTIGPNCKVGGEVKNTVFLANSNKGHEGFVGNSVVGEWCNFGADTNTSNLKNNYQRVRLWNYQTKAYEDTGQQFCGLMMGDHSKCSINTMFNTGTVVGVFANIFGTDFPAKFVPSFTWGGIDDHATYQFDKAIEVYERVLQRRNRSLPAEEVALLQHIFEQRFTEFPD